MRLYLHATRRDALTVGETTLTRWSLAGPTPSKLLEISIAPHLLLNLTILQDGRIVSAGDVAHAPAGEIFALASTNQERKYTDPCLIELRHWETLSLATTLTLPQARGSLCSLAGSPDGRWLVVTTGWPERLFLLDWHTGQVMSHHAVGGSVTSGLAFDATSTFLAGVCCHDAWGHLMLWRVVPAERWSPRMEERLPRLALEPDEIHGPYALNPEYWQIDRTGVAWPACDLADTIGETAFSPNSRLVVFRLISAYNHPFIEFLAYEVASGKQRWCIRREARNGEEECFTFTPDGRYLLICGQDNELTLYRTDDGMLHARVPSACLEPIEALAFDYDGKTLWLATEDSLLPYHLSRV